MKSFIHRHAFVIICLWRTFHGTNILWLRQTLWRNAYSYIRFTFCAYSTFTVFLFMALWKVFNSYPPCAAYMRQWIGSALIPVKACRLAMSPCNGLAPSYYLNQCCIIVNWITRNNIMWNLNRNSYISIQEKASENIACEMADILSRGGLFNWFGDVWRSYVIILSSCYFPLRPRVVYIGINMSLNWTKISSNIGLLHYNTEPLSHSTLMHCQMGPLGTNFRGIWIRKHNEVNLETPSTISWLFCSGVNAASPPLQLVAQIIWLLFWPCICFHS